MCFACCILVLDVNAKCVEESNFQVEKPTIPDPTLGGMHR